MVIKRTLTADEYNGASQEDKDLYRANDDGGYDFIGENAGALKRGKERLASEKTSLNQEYLAMKEKLREYESEKEEAARKQDLQKADSQKVDERWRKKYDKDLQEQKDHLTRLQNTIKSQHREGVINNVVNEVALPQYKEIVKMMYDKRVDVELDADNVPRTVIKDVDNNATQDSIKELTKEFRKDTRYADIFKTDSKGRGTVENKATPLPQSPQQQFPYQEQQMELGDSHKGALPITNQLDFAKFMNAHPNELKNYTGDLPPEGTPGIDY